MSAFTMKDSEEGNEVVLHAVLDLSTAEELLQGFRACLENGKKITVIGAEVERLTTPCLQILVAVKNKTSQLNIEFIISEMSDAFEKALKDIGLDQQFFIPLEQQA